MAAAVVPCYNEARTIGELVRGIRKRLSNVVVVDDGSSDATRALALDAGAWVLRHERNRGKGAALQTGLKAAWDRGYSWAALLDGDGQHSPEDIPALLACAEATGAELVIGNRMQKPEDMSWLRRLVNRWMSREISRLAGRPIPDSQCGFRLIKLAAWERFDFRASHFEVESEMALGFARRGCRVEFVPVQTIPRSRPSHIRPLRDTWRWGRWWREELNKLNELNELNRLHGSKELNGLRLEAANEWEG